MLPIPVLSQERQTDLRVLVDVSGSMQKNDPQNLRRDALRLLIGLVPDDARIGIWSFGQYVNMQVKPDFPTKQWKKNARKEANKIHSRGLYTNIEDTLIKSTWDWKKSDPKWNRHLILLTDGRVDISKQASKNAASRQRILNKILPQLKSAGVKVHTIALSNKADHELLKQLAKNTDAWYESVDNADKLKRVFLHLFEKSTPTDTLPLQGNRFEVDNSIDDMTVLVFRDKDSKPTSIVRPDNTGFQFGQIPRNVEWHHDAGFDLITVHKPQKGQWRINAAIDPDNRVKIITNLKLRVSEIPNNIPKGEMFKLDAALYESGQLLNNKELLSLVDMHLVASYSDGTKIFDSSMKMSKSVGHYVADVSGLEKMGEVNILLRAVGPTFRREFRHQIRVLDSPVSLKVEQEGDQYFITVTENPLLVQTGTLQLALRFDGDATAYHVPKQGANLWQASIDKAYASQRFVILARAKLIGNKGFQTQLSGVLPEPVIEDFDPLSFEVKEDEIGFSVIAKEKLGMLQIGTLRLNIKLENEEEKIRFMKSGAGIWQAKIANKFAEKTLSIAADAYKLSGIPYQKAYEVKLPISGYPLETENERRDSDKEGSQSKSVDGAENEADSADEDTSTNEESLVDEKNEKKESDWLFITISIVVINILLGVGGYFGYRYWKNSETAIGDDFDSDEEVMDAISSSFDDNEVKEVVESKPPQVDKQVDAEPVPEEEDFEAQRKAPEPPEAVSLDVDPSDSKQELAYEGDTILPDMLDENKPDDLPELDDILEEGTDEADEPVETNDEDLADAWGAALEESGDAPKEEGDTEASDDTDTGSDEDLADAWGAALEESGDVPKEDAAAEANDDTDTGSDEDLADAWGAALEESGDLPKEEGATEACDDAGTGSDEDLADAWGAALEESGDVPKEEGATETSDDAGTGSDEDLADAWGAALEESGDMPKEDDKAKVKKDE